MFGWETLAIRAAASRCGRCRATATTSRRTTRRCATRWPSSAAPPGFEDVVASSTRSPAISPTCRAHWSVTFAVDDADATAEKADELGGKVIVPPFDAPWVRMTVIADPQGATFIASKFVPENRDLSPGAEASVGAA